MADLFTKSIIDILNEASDCEACSNEELELDGELEDEYDDVEELEDDIEYTEEMVNVILQESNSQTKYLIEYDNLCKLMESKRMDIKEAMISVCEHNQISFSHAYLVLESDETFAEALNEAKASIKYANNPIDKTKNKKKVGKVYDTFKDIKNKGIKVLKKKSKKK